MKVSIKITLLISLMVSFLFAQKTSSDQTGLSQHNVGLELFGGTSDWALFYERMTLIKEGQILSTGIGLGMTYPISIFDKKDALLAITPHISMNLGKENGLFEIGLEGLAFPTRSPEDGARFTLYNTLGYRYQPRNSGGFMMKVGFKIPTLLVLTWDEKYFSGARTSFIPSLSLGYAF